MKNVGRLVTTITLLAAGPVAAQPGADSEAPPEVIVVTPAPVVVTPLPAPGQTVAPVPAPQNEDWNNVSHINGYPVKVGERGEFLKANPKKTSISSNPIGWLVGFYGVSVTHAVSDNIAIRGDANLIDLRDSNTKGYELGASLPIYFKRVFHGPFIEPGLIIRDFDDKDEAEFSTGPSDNASVGPSVVFGWHWTFDSGLNVAAAFGLMRNLAKDQMEFGDSDIEPSGYFRVGYAF